MRQSEGGFSAAYDCQGRLLTSRDEYHSTDLTFIAQGAGPWHQNHLFQTWRLAGLGVYPCCLNLNNCRLEAKRAGHRIGRRRQPPYAKDETNNGIVPYH